MTNSFAFIRRTAILAACLVFLLALGSAAQQAPAPEGVIRINVNLVQVDAIVTDRDGKPVKDLTADDFDLLQDGKPQTITNFAFVNVRDASVRFALPPAAPAVNPAAPPPPRMELRPEQIRRTIAIVIDDLGLSFPSTVRIRESLKKWVDTEMQPGDIVAIIRTSAGMGALQQFTADKRMLYAAIDQVQYHLGRVGVSSFAALDGVLPDFALDTAFFDDQVQQAYTLGSIGAVNYVLQGLRDLPGRKSLVLFSESMRFDYLEGPGLVNVPTVSRGMVEERLRSLADAANRSSVVIYSIDPRGVEYTGLTAEDNTRGMDAAQISAVAGQRTQDLIASQDGMIVLSQRTGGLFLHNNDVAGNLRQVIDDGDGYYLLGYQPDSETFDALSRSPKFHSISVRVKVPGLRVRSRTGFFGTPDAAAPPPTTRGGQISKALGSPFGGGALQVRLTTLFAYADKQGSFINGLLHFDPHQLTFSEQPDGVRRALVDIVAVTFNADGRPVDAVDRTWEFRLSPATYEKVMRDGLTYTMQLPVKKPGAYQMRAVVRDATSQQLGTATQFIEVPDVKKGRLVLSGIVLSTERPQTAETAEDPYATAAVRVFKAQSPIVYAYYILNARTDRKKNPQLEIYTRLFRDGQQVFAGAPTTVSTDGQPNPKRLVGAGRLQLAKASPGRYVLQVVVRDKLAKEYGIAAQSMDFEIRE